MMGNNFSSFPTYQMITDTPTGYELAPNGPGLWSVVVPEPTQNLFQTPSFEDITIPRTGYLTGSAQGSFVSETNQKTRSRGAYSLKIEPLGATSVYMQIPVFYELAYLSTVMTWSCDIVGCIGKKIELTAYQYSSSTVLASTTVDIISQVQRVFVTFRSPGGVTGVDIRITRLSTLNDLAFFYIDACQLETKSYPTSYVDGDQPGCVWDGAPHNSTSRRLDGAMGGRLYSFKDDLEIKVKGFSGFGMPEIENLTEPYAYSGGSYYQSTNIKEQTSTIVAHIEAPSLNQLQSIRQKLIGLLSPNRITKQAKNLLLHYQPLDPCGRPIGKKIEIPCLYAAGLNRKTEGVFSETLGLQFIELQPPSMRESGYELTKLLSTNLLTYLLTTKSLLRRTSQGVWETRDAIAEPRTFVTDRKGETYIGADALGRGIFKLSSSNFFLQTTTGGGVRSLVTGPDNTLYAGGSFTAPHSYIEKYNGTSFSAVGTAGLFNGAINALAVDTNGSLYATGAFTTPGGRVAMWNGTTWAALGSGINGTGFALARPATTNQMYVAGAFTTANGVTVSNIALWNGTTFTALGSGANNQINALAMGADGNLYAAGTFTVAGGIGASRIAKWNGTQWQSLGAGLNGSVSSLNFDRLGNLWVGGAFTATGDGKTLTRGLAVWSGSAWFNVDLSLPLQVNAVYPLTDDSVLVGYAADGSGLVKTSATVDIDFAGSVETYPRFTVNGPGRLYQLANLTTGVRVYFDYNIQNNETLTFSFAPGSFKASSNYYGNIASRITQGANLTQLGLHPGFNKLAVFVDNSDYSSPEKDNTRLIVAYYNVHWSIDGGMKKG